MYLKMSMYLYNMFFSFVSLGPDGEREPGGARGTWRLHNDTYNNKRTKFVNQIVHTSNSYIRELIKCLKTVLTVKFINC